MNIALLVFHYVSLIESKMPMIIDNIFYIIQLNVIYILIIKYQQYRLLLQSLNNKKAMASKVQQLFVNKNRINNVQLNQNDKNIIKGRIYSARQQPQKCLVLNKHQVKLKKHNNPSKSEMIHQNNENIWEILKEKQQKYQCRIKELEDQVNQYMNYMEQYEQLAQKNKKLEEQMAIILQELQNINLQTQRTQSPLLRKKLRTQNSPTLESSIEEHLHTPSSHNYISSRSITKKKQNVNLSKDEEIQYLCQYIKNLQKTIEMLIEQNKQFQKQLKMNIKKDMNDMEQRLMNYFFGLEEKVNENSLKYHVSQKFQTFRDCYNDFQGGINGQISKKSSFKQMKQTHNDVLSSNFLKLLTPQQKNTRQQQYSQKFKKDSVISFTNFQISNQPQQQYKKNINSQNTVKKQVNKQQLPIENTNINKCLNCLQYLQMISQLEQKVKNLQSLTKQNLIQPSKQYMKQFPLANKKQNYHQQYSKSKEHVKQNKMEHQQVLQQFRKQQQNNRCQQIYERINLLQSQINKIVESLVPNQLSTPQNYGDKLFNGKSNENNEKYWGGYGKYQQVDIVGKENNIIWSSNNYWKIQRVKQQLVNVIQEIKQLVQKCEIFTNNGIVKQLTDKIKEQEEHIIQLEKQRSRLMQTLEEGKTKREWLDKFMKIQGREQKEKVPPYFRPLESPISCIDHNGTKDKINQILSSMKKFEVELREENHPNIELFTNKF